MIHDEYVDPNIRVMLRVMDIEETRRLLAESEAQPGTSYRKLAYECDLRDVLRELEQSNRVGRPRPDFDPRLDYPERYREGPV